jgi:predicted amidohydrolase YtcJ
LKSKLTLPLFISGLLVGVAIWFVFQKPQQVSLILINGAVYTVDDRNPVAEAVAIKGNIIAGVGSTEEILASFVAADTIDLQGKAVYPGFIDAHAHVEGLGAALMNLNLAGATSIQEIQARVREHAGRLPAGSWVRGRGWDQNRWPGKEFPTSRMLDEAVRDVPVYLTRIDGHAVWVNSKVLLLAGITKDTPDPEGGKIMRDRAGNPAGVFIDNAIDVLNDVLPAASVDERREAIMLAIRECARYGLTGVHDMGVDKTQIEIYRKLIDENSFPIRIYAAIGGLGETWDHYRDAGPEIGGFGSKLTVRALKLYADGALGSRGAALIEPYSDDSPNRGLTLTSSEDLEAAVNACLERGFQPCTHAIGDRGNHIALNVYEKRLNSLQMKDKDRRLRVEHAQVLHQDDIPRFKQLGVIPSMQPTHCTSDMYWAEARVGPERIKGAYAWRTLLETGVVIPGGSDFPVEDINPLWGFYAAITRQDHVGWPEGGWYPEQRMSRDEALKSFTLWAAYAAFEESQKGSIQKGKLADLVVLSDDIMKTDPPKILETRVEMTILGGEVVYARDKGLALGSP